MHPGPDLRPAKAVNKWSGDASTLISAFTRISKPLPGVSPLSPNLSGDYAQVGEVFEGIYSHLQPGCSLL